MSSAIPLNSKLFELRYYQGQKCIQRYSYMLVRPPRFVYSQKIIDPSKRYKSRFKHQIYNIPFPLSVYLPQQVRYLILYLHGNSSSRYQAFNNLTNLPQGVGMACFDFNGCGNRTENRFISLGKDESKEVDSAVIFLRSKGYKVALWGRSMGAVSALLSTQADVVVADSAFSSLYQTSKQLVSTQIPCACYCCFQCLFPCFFWIVGKDVEEKCNFHPSDLEVYKNMEQTRTDRNILFLAAKSDQIIHYSHTEKLFQHFPGPKKKKIIFQGNHNSERTQQIVSQIFTFFQQYFTRLNNEKIEQIPSNLTQKTQSASLQVLYNSLNIQKISVGGFSEQINDINCNF